VNIGDRFRIGTAEVMVTQPRFPCFKLNLKFVRVASALRNRDDMVQRFLTSRLSGIYFSVVRAGEVVAGDAIERIGRDENNVSNGDIVQIYVREADLDLVRRAVRVPALAASLKTYFQQQLE
jgi:MOSC domain-containing protein YiiM